jgi:hypothetical protein
MPRNPQIDGDQFSVKGHAFPGRINCKTFVHLIAAQMNDRVLADIPKLSLGTIIKLILEICQRGIL